MKDETSLVVPSELQGERELVPLLNDFKITVGKFREALREASPVVRIAGYGFISATVIFFNIVLKAAARERKKCGEK